MADEQTQPGPQQEYHTVGGLSGHLLRNEMVDQPDVEKEAVEEIAQPEPPVIPQEPAPEQEPQPQAAQGEMYSYKKPDGTEGTFELSTNPEERAKQIASLASGKDAYLLNREIVKQENPELASNMYKLMQNQTEILSTMSEQQKQQQQEADPTSVLTDQQKVYYRHLVDNGDDVGAQAYLSSQFATNTLLYDTMQEMEELKKQQQQQAVAPRIERNIAKLRQFDPSLPDPNTQPKDFYQAAFQHGKYGGYLRGMGMDDQLIFYGNIDHDSLYKAYEMTTNPSTNNTQQAQVQPGAIAPGATASTTNVSPDVLKTMQDVSGGQSRSMVGNEPEKTKLSQATTRREMRALDRDGNVSDSFLGGMGGAISDYVDRKRAGKKFSQ
jgi:hypothetical protein